VSWKNFHLCLLLCFLLLNDFFSIPYIYARPRSAQKPAVTPRPAAAPKPVSAPRPRSEAIPQTQASAAMCVDGSPKNRVLDQQVKQSEFAGLIKNQNVNPNRLMQSLDKYPACVTEDRPAPGLENTMRRYGDFNRYFQSLRNQGRIRPECIAASMNRSVPNDGYICKGPADQNPKVIDQQDKEQPCLTPDVVNHVTWVVNQALSCMGALNQPINPEIIYRKINGETGFKFYKAYSGGVGIGQLISAGATRQVLSDNTPIYEVFKNSREPACQPLKKSVLDAERRLEAQPGGRGRSISNMPAPKDNAKTQDLSPKNYCNLVSTTQGLAAGMMISLMYFAHTRSQYVENDVRGILGGAGINDLLQQQKFIDLTTLAAYGPRGNNGVGDMLPYLRQSVRLAPGGIDKVWNEFQRLTSQNVGYIKNVETNAKSALTQVQKFNEKTGRNFQASSTADCIEPATAK
jgi:hypothetical protein